MLGILNCCPRALPHKHDGLVFPLRERLQRRDIVLVVRIGYRISRLRTNSPVIRWVFNSGDRTVFPYRDGDNGIAQRCHAAVNNVNPGTI